MKTSTARKPVAPAKSNVASFADAVKNKAAAASNYVAEKSRDPNVRGNVATAASFAGIALMILGVQAASTYITKRIWLA